MPAYITAIGTAVPDHRIDQQLIANFMCQALSLNDTETRRLKALYKHTKIQQRHSVISDYSQENGAYTFFPNNADLEPFPSILPRMLEYRKHAMPLAKKAIDQCFANLNDSIKSTITHLITVSCTGMYAPGLDIDIVQTMGLQTNIKRTCINFMGCYGAFNALKLADSICNADANAKVLIVSVELCTLHFQKKISDNNLLSNALFADGAAAVVVEGSRHKESDNGRPTQIGVTATSSVYLPDTQTKKTCLKLKSFYCDLFAEGQNDMEWNIADNGFEMILTPNVPKIVKSGIGKLFDKLLKESDLQKEDITMYALHPGGKAILEAIESALELTKEDNKFAYEILANYGNMSSATVLFVIKNLMDNLLESDQSKNILSCAFGPGLTLESMILEVV
jgi:alpha-pyrone synthase